MVWATVLSGRIFPHRLDVATYIWGNLLGCACRTSLATRRWMVWTSIQRGEGKRYVLPAALKCPFPERVPRICARHGVVCTVLHHPAMPVRIWRCEHNSGWCLAVRDCFPGPAGEVGCCIQWVHRRKLSVAGFAAAGGRLGQLRRDHAPWSCSNDTLALV